MRIFLKGKHWDGNLKDIYDYEHLISTPKLVINKVMSTSKFGLGPEKWENVASYIKERRRT